MEPAVVDADTRLGTDATSTYVLAACVLARVHRDPCSGTHTNLVYVTVGGFAQGARLVVG